ncbi:MAG: sterol desaturase family protein [Azoarcus sp.]|nr:sterol desaturase family protein [Azoarcus sp.]
MLGETLILTWTRRQSVDWHDVAFNLNSGHIVMWLFRGLEMACFGYLEAHYSRGYLDNWPLPLVWLFALLVWDFCFYWLHRLHHHFGAMWAVHVVHHQGEHYNLSLGVRNSWYSSLTSIPFFMLLALIGLPLEIFAAVSILHYSIQLFNHNALTPSLGILEKIFVTPSHHRVHHVNDMAYANTNFGGSFIFWDKLFGTFCPALPETPFGYGVKGEKSSANPFWASNLPFLRYARSPFVPGGKARLYHCSPFSIISGAILLFVLLVGYIWQYGYGYAGISLPQVALSVLLVAGCIALGGMMEGRRWGTQAWLLITLALPLFFIAHLGWPQLYWQAAMGGIALHGAAVALGWGRKASDLAGDAMT